MTTCCLTSIGAAANHEGTDAVRQPAEPASEVVAELDLRSPRTPDASAAMRTALGCMRLHRVDVERVLIARDGRRAIVIFRAPDAEAVRLACRNARIAVARIWTCRE